VEELRREEFAEGRILLAQKLEQYAPQVIAFNGKMAYQNFSQRPCELGLQKQPLYGALVFVLPSTSGKKRPRAKGQAALFPPARQAAHENCRRADKRCGCRANRLK